jgi:hypothetical protein
MLSPLMQAPPRRWAILRAKELFPTPVVPTTQTRIFLADFFIFIFEKGFPQKGRKCDPNPFLGQEADTVLEEGEV